MSKLLRFIVASLGLAVVAAVFGVVFLAPRYMDNINFRCQVDLQFARLSSALFKPLEVGVKMDRIQMSKDMCESEKKREKFFKELDETLEYFF